MLVVDDTMGGKVAWNPEDKYELSDIRHKIGVEDVLSKIIDELNEELMLSKLWTSLRSMGERFHQCKNNEF